MKEQFNQAAATRFGSGWAWLGVKPDGSLAITSTPNQDNPLMVLFIVRTLLFTHAVFTTTPQHYEPSLLLLSASYLFAR